LDTIKQRDRFQQFRTVAVAAPKFLSLNPATPKTRERRDSHELSSHFEVIPKEASLAVCWSSSVLIEIIVTDTAVVVESPK